jgi:hypothetical protein
VTTEFETSPIETRPWVLPKAEPRTQIESVQRGLLNDASGRAFLFALLCDAKAFDQQPTPADFGAQLLTRLIEIDELGVGSMWAEGMATKHAKRTGKKQ